MWSRDKIFNRDNFWLIISILAGLAVGLLITWYCLKNNLRILGVNLDIFISPVVAGFVETFVSNITRKKSSGAISSIILFFVTNGIGWLFPANPISFNIFTVGGIILMLQAAFPLMINYLLIALALLFSYVMGVVGGFIVILLNKGEKTAMTVSEIEDYEKLGVVMFNSKPEIPIEKYHGMIFAEDVVQFEEKAIKDRIQYMGSSAENKNLLKHHDYAVSRKYILHNLEKEAVKINANAIIDIQFEYTNYNQQMPPDVLIAAYGTAVTIDEKYLF